MISQRLLSRVRCPECRGELLGTPAELQCRSCGRYYRTPDADYLDLRPQTPFAEMTKYLDPALHADAGHEIVSPPLLSAAIRNDMLRRFLAIEAGDRVIDLGCGSGRALVWNRDLGAHLVGLDVSPFFAGEARAHVDLLVGDLRRLPLADGAFTKAFSLDVLEHLSREDLVAMLRETARVLVPGGAVFVYSHVRRNSPLAAGLRAINRLAGALERLGLVDLSHERLRKSDHRNPLADIDDLQRVTAEAGFRVARLRYYTPLVGAFIENIVVKIAERFLRRLAARRPANLAPGPGSSTEAAHHVRLEAKQHLARRGLVYLALRALTWLMKLDLVLFGRIPSGPFFAVLVKREAGSRGLAHADPAGRSASP